MNDRLRYRVYNKKTKEMLDVMLISYSKSGNNCRIDAQNSVGDIIIFDDYKKNTEDIVLMQCTGLKDKNGTLIYEGNILKEYYENSDTETTEFDYVPVGFDKECAAFYMGAKHKEYFADGLFIPEEYEVVGNIYENKKLLEE